MLKNLQFHSLPGSAISVNITLCAFSKNIPALPVWNILKIFAWKRLQNSLLRERSLSWTLHCLWDFRIYPIFTGNSRRNMG